MYTQNIRQKIKQKMLWADLMVVFTLGAQFLLNLARSLILEKLSVASTRKVTAIVEATAISCTQNTCHVTLKNNSLNGCTKSSLIIKQQKKSAKKIPILSSDPDLAPANSSQSVHPLLVITNKQTLVELPTTADAIKEMKIIIREVADMNPHVTTEVIVSPSEATDATEVVTTTMTEEEAIGDATIIEGMTVTVGMVDPATAMRVEEETINLKVVVEESTVDSMRNHPHENIITRRSQEIWDE